MTNRIGVNWEEPFRMNNKAVMSGARSAAEVYRGGEHAHWAEDGHPSSNLRAPPDKTSRTRFFSLIEKAATRHPNPPSVILAGPEVYLP